MSNHRTSLRAAGFALALTALATQAAFAAAPRTGFVPGMTLVSFGAGPSGDATLYGGAAFLQTTVERSFSRNFSGGFFAGRVGTSGVALGTDRLTGLSCYAVGGRGSYHLSDLIDEARLDLYVGGSVGREVTQAWVNPETGGQEHLRDDAWVYGAHAGARWFVKPNFAVYAETAAYQREAQDGTSVDWKNGAGDLHAGVTIGF